MMIEDEELRSLYQITCQDRLRILEAGLLAPEAPSGESLETLRRESHSLKGDSRVVGLKGIAEIASQLELLTKTLQQQGMSWELLPADCLEKTLQALTQLVDSATTGVDVEINAEQVSARLRQAISEAVIVPPESPAEPAPEPPGEFDLDKPSGEASAGNLPSVSFIEDDETRALYRTASETRLQAIATVLEQLAEHPHDKTALATLSYEARGLKGDSLLVEQTAVAELIQPFEAIADSLVLQAGELTSSGCDRLWQTLQQIEQLVHEATTDTPSDLSPETIQQQIEQLSIQIADTLQIKIAPDSPNSHPDTLDTFETPSDAITLIEDEELCEIYRATSEKRLQLLEAELLQLEKTPENPDVLATAIREAHSLKGDAQSIQVEPIESLARTFENVLGGIQRREMQLTPALNGGLRQLLLAVSTLVQTVTTGMPNNVDVEQVIETVVAIAAQSPPPEMPESAESLQSALERHLPHQLADQSADFDEEPAALSAIEDEELREIYKTSSAERLQRLELGFAQLESQPDNLEILAELLREAHSLKGDARSVGLGDIERLTHAIEGILIAIQAQ
ncbi:MAG: Hpt domain-containing protein, partial [Phormidesmis sp.]